MTWQKQARLGIAVFIVLFVGFVAVALRHRRAPAAPATSPRTDDKAISQTVGRGVVEQKNKEGKTVFSIAFEGQSVYENGRTVLGNVKLTLPDKGGRAIEVTAKRAEILTPPGTGQRVGTAKLTGEVRMKTSDGITVEASEATYNETDATITVPGRVTFARGRMRGSGLGATYDQNRDVLWLLDQAQVTIAEDKQGAGAMRGSAGSAGLARADHYLRLSKAAHVVAEERTIDADEITAFLTPDDEHVQVMELRGHSRITGSGRDVQSMSADNIDLTYAADGRTLQNSRLMQNAVLQLPGDPGKRNGRRISASAIDLTMAPDGRTVTNLNATEHVQVDLPADGDQPARRVRSTALMAVGAPGTGLQSATFVDQVEFRENRAARKTQPAIDRTARADKLIMETKPGLGAIQQADFHGNVHFTDGTETTAEAPRAVYQVDRDEIGLSPGEAGEPGPSPSVNDGKVSVEARNIHLVLGTQKLSADTKVRSWMQAEKKPAGTSGAQGGGGEAAPGRRGTPEKSRVPSMLKQDEQVNVIANRLEYDGSKSLATYTGSANLWQGETTVKAHTIVLDSANGNLTARTNVTTVMLFDDVDPKTNQHTPTRTTATADALVYEDAKRVASYTGNESSKAHLAGAQGDLTGARIDLYLKPEGHELERMDVNGTVVVIESARTAQGNHLTYTSSDDRYVMTGTPVEVVEVTPPNCKKTIGATLTFKRSVSSIAVEGNGVYGQQSSPVACPAGRS